MIMRPLLAVIAAALIMMGCSKTVYVTQPLPLPPRPALPPVTAAELQCLPDDVYGRMLQRQRLGRHHRDKLEAVIKATRVAK